MRILLFSGKGGVGKTSVAAATGLRLAERGKRTLVMSVDPAHSLSDSFDLGTDLFQGATADPYKITGKLFIQEVNIQKEIKRHWREIASYVVSILRTTGISEVEAEELAILPGMEELSAMMYVNQYRKENRYDVVVLDCAPTAESMRFVSMPTTLEWYMKHVFPFQRTVVKAVRPIAKRVSPVELPPDKYFANVKELFGKLDGIDELLEDPQRTSVRLVTNPETHGAEGDAAGLRLLLAARADGGPRNRQSSAAGRGRATNTLRNGAAPQTEILEEMDGYFAPVLVKRVPLFTQEVLGRQRLEQLAEVLYEKSEDPAEAANLDRPYSFEKVDGHYEVRLRLPFATKGRSRAIQEGGRVGGGDRQPAAAHRTSDFHGVAVAGASAFGQPVVNC